MKEAVAVVWVHDPFLSALPPPRAAATFLPHLPTAAAAVDCSVLPIVHVHCCQEEVMDWVLHSWQSRDFPMTGWAFSSSLTLTIPQWWAIPAWYKQHRQHRAWLRVEARKTKSSCPHCYSMQQWTEHVWSIPHVQNTWQAVIAEDYSALQCNACCCRPFTSCTIICAVLVLENAAVCKRTAN